MNESHLLSQLLVQLILLGETSADDRRHGDPADGTTVGGNGGVGVGEKPMAMTAEVPRLDGEKEQSESSLFQREREEEDEEEDGGGTAKSGSSAGSAPRLLSPPLTPPTTASQSWTGTRACGVAMATASSHFANVEPASGSFEEKTWKYCIFFFVNI